MAASLLFALLLPQLTQADFKTSQRPWVLAIDAGSTGTRLYVYQFSRDPRTLGGAQLLSEASHKIRPGLASFARFPHRVAGYLAPLIDFAKTIVPAAEHSQTLLFLAGTGGVRSIASATEKYSLLKFTTGFLSKTPFYAASGCSRQAAFELPGHLEALYGWTAVNLVLNVPLSKSNRTDAQNCNKNSVYGFLDMGGSSTQLAAIIEDGSGLSPSCLLRQKMATNRAGFRDILKSISYPGLGKEAATLVMLGYSERQREYKSHCINPNFKGLLSFENISIEVTGETPLRVGQRWAACSASAQLPLKGRELPKNIMSRLPANTDFVAVNSFYYIAKTLNTLGYLTSPVPGRVTFADFSSAIRKACLKPTTVGQFEPYVCMNGAYIHSLLRNGYGMEDQRGLRFVNKIDGYSVGWQLGLALDFIVSPDGEVKLA